MRGSRFKEEQIIAILREQEAGVATADVCRKHGIMDPEDGHLWVYGVGEDGVAAFTDFGIENLKQLVADLRADGKAPPPKTKPI